MVSVITVNFNGEAYLPGLLAALERQTYRPFEVLVVDNGSTDDSITLVRSKFPNVRVLAAGGNVGFAQGNNLGIRAAQGEYVALINNDTIPEPEWLARLVQATTYTSEIAGAGSKILFARPFLRLHLEVPTFVPAKVGSADDTRSLGAFVSELSSFAGCSYRKPVFESGFYGPEKLHDQRGQWMGACASLLLPVENLYEPGSLELRVFGGASPENRPLKVSVGKTRLAVIQLASEWNMERVLVPREQVRQEGGELINNAASFLRPDGAAGDRGIFELDNGQYDQPEDVEALCGCSMLLARRALEEVGLFDSDYFMYFEDTELSWRLRKRGFRLRYEPTSVLRHVHAATSVEWSPLFNFLVTRNRILMLIKHAPVPIILKAYAEELYRLLRLLALRRSLADPETRIRLKVQLSLLNKAPRALLKRLGLLRH